MIVLCLYLVTSEAPDYQALKDSLMRMKAKPNPGPNMDTVYVPGTPGGQWSEEEIRITRSLHSFLSKFKPCYKVLPYQEKNSTNDSPSLANQKKDAYS